MLYPIYNSILTVLAPMAKCWLQRHTRYAALSERFAPEPPVGLPEGVIWVQACSVGEVNTSASLLTMLQERFPETGVLLTISTLSGQKLAQERCAAVAQTWFPFDTRTAVRGFLKTVRPAVLILVETEVWPNVMRECRKAGVPVVVVNGRLSEKHFGRYHRYRRWLRPVFAQLTKVGVQNALYAERFVALGVPEEAIELVGNVKFDGVTTELDAGERRRLAQANGFRKGEPLLLFGSTRPGDEALAAACWKEIREAFPTAKLLIAPRHMKRLQEVLSEFSEPVLLRSEVLAGRKPAGERILVVDTVGELVKFYALATVAVVGGSFFEGVNGHNPLEPAALGTPTVFGPFMSNFPDPAERLVAGNGAVQVQQPADLCAVLLDLLGDAARCRQLGTRGRGVVLRSRGALARNVDLVASVLKERSGG